jgi:F0F1-type ATP synthase assembly protein I
MGMEFAAAFGAFVALGWWLGERFDWNPWATLVGAGLGLTGAMYNLIREGLKMQRESESERRKASSKDSDKQTDDRD